MSLVGEELKTAHTNRAGIIVKILGVFMAVFMTGVAIIIYYEIHSEGTAGQGVVDCKKGNYRKAIPELQAYLKAHPDPSHWDWYYLAYAYYQTGQYAQAEQAERVTVVKSESPDDHFLMAEILLKENKKMEARDQLEQTFKYFNGNGGRMKSQAQSMLDQIDKSQ